MTSSTKRCGRCKRRLPVGKFNFRDKAKQRRQSYCRDCSNAAWREWYAIPENKAHHLEVLKVRRGRRNIKNQTIVRALKMRPCSECGQTFPPQVMDFDHLGEKDAIVSSLVYTVSTSRLIAEIMKCEVVCANCHRIRTVARRMKQLEERSSQL